MPKKGKGIRCQYDPAVLRAASLAVKSGKMSLRNAEKKFKVPKSTIHNHVTGVVADGRKPEKQPVFPLEVEEEIAKKVKEAGKMGFGITRAQLAFKVARLANIMKINTPFRNGIPGKDWLAGFRKRHPDISLRAPTPLNNIRARMLNKDVTNKYFQDLGTTFTQLDIQNAPHRIWNIDETNVSLTHKPSKILAECGQRNIPGRVGNSRDGITVLGCVNAAGQDIPPLVIVKGLTEKSLNAYNVAEGPIGTKYTYQKKAWMEDVLGVTWFKDHFLTHCGPERPQIIILDSHSSHETLGLIQVAREHNVALFALPPHTTQYLNPLDKTIFGPFQRTYNRVCTDFMNVSPNNLVNKWEWPKLFKEAYVKAFNKENTVKGFEVCGIYPFKPDRIPQSAFAPSLPFDSVTGPEIGTTVPGVATLPEVQAAPEIASVPGVATVPEIASVPGVAAVSEIASVPGVATVPEIASVPGVAAVPEIASVPGVATVPEIASVPGVAAVSEIASVPGVAAVPEIASVPGVAVIPEIASVPGVAAVPEIASVPGVTAVPEIASMSGIANVQEVAGVPETTTVHDGIVIATGNDDKAVPLNNAEELYELLIGGNLQILNEEGDNLQDTLESNSHMHADLRSWNEEISSVFDLPKSELKQSKTVNTKKLTKHRLLTSDEIYHQKREEQEKKRKRGKENSTA